METNTARVGDKVTGFYGDVAFVGTVVSFASGGVEIKLSAPIDLGFRVESDGLWLSKNQREGNPLRVIEAAQ